MKLSPNLIEYIQSVVRVCRLVGIESVIIEQGLVRGTHGDRTVALIQNEGVPELPFGAIGLTRLDILQSRFDVVKNMKNVSIEANPKENTNFIFSLTMKGEGIKIDYRCSDPSKIEARRNVKDTMMHRVKVNPDLVSMLTKGISAMNIGNAQTPDVVSIISNTEGVSIELVDVSNDVFKYVFAPNAEPIGVGATGKFAHRYPAKLLLTLLRDNPEGYFEVGSMGLLKMSVSGFNVVVVPMA
jgi:hypothetical protein